MYKVLLVDDEPFSIEGLKLLVDWEEHGFQIEAVYGNGKEALQHIRQNPPDLVVTDICMPVMNGLELIQETRRLGNHSTLFILMSGHQDFNYARQAMSLGVAHYLTKPVISIEAGDALAQLQEELHAREQRQLIRDRAYRYGVGQALAALLFGGEEEDKREAMQTLSTLTSTASAWTYLHIVTDGDGSGSAREAVQQAAEETACGYLVDCGPGMFGLVLGLGKPGEGRHAGEEGIRLFAERLLQSMQRAAAGRTGIAVGCCVDRLDDLSQSGSSALEAEPFLFFGSRGIVHYEDIRHKTLSIDPGVLLAADAIVEAVESGRPEAVTAEIRNAFHTFEERMTLPELVSIFSTQVMLRCALLYRDMGGDPDALVRESGFSLSGWQGRGLWKSADMLSVFCLACQSAMSILQETQTGGTQAKVADFLRRNYKETITVKELAERFYINPVYLGQSFSRKYGMGILDFVHDLRIEEAKRLLRETDCASCVIAESLGYRGYQHFLRQFEKRLGMKPAEYRLLITGGTHVCVNAKPKVNLDSSTV